MKRDIRLNMTQLAGTCQAIQEHMDNVLELKVACEACLKVMEKQKSVSFEALSSQMRDVIIVMIEGAWERMNDLRTILFRYIGDMEQHIMPQDEGIQIRVDRNDIWKNIREIEEQTLKLTDMCDMLCGRQSMPDYKSNFVDPETEEGQACLLEQQRRERNYAKIKVAWNRWATDARAVMENSIDGIWDIYNKSIIPFENTDDDYKKEVLELDGTWGYVENFAVEAWGVVRGMWDGLAGAADTAWSMALFLLLDFGTIKDVLQFFSLEIPDSATDRVEEVENTIRALPVILEDPGAAFEAMGQGMMDTYDEEGIGYAIGNIFMEIALDIAVEKGGRKLWSALKAGDILEDTGSIGRFFKRLTQKLDPDTNLSDEFIEGTRAAERGFEGHYRPYTPEMRHYIIPPKDGFEAYLERVYIEIRKTGLDDIETIARNTGLPEQDLIKLKEHLFLETHEISYKGRALEELYFQADPDIAHAWQRAMEGDLSPSEKEWFEQLLNHELTESAYMEQGMPYRDPATYGTNGIYAQDPTLNAHDRANLTAPQPGDYPEYKYGKEFLDHVDDDIVY